MGMQKSPADDLKAFAATLAGQGLVSSNRIVDMIGAARFEESGLYGYRKRFDEIVSAFYKTEEKRLLNRLKKHRENHLLIAADFAVPFDNNLSERDLRMVKTKGKVPGCFGSLQGAKIFANLMSITKTAVKQGVSPFVAVKGVFASGLGLA